MSAGGGPLLTSKSARYSVGGECHSRPNEKTRPGKPQSPAQVRPPSDARDLAVGLAQGSRHVRHPKKRLDGPRRLLTLRRPGLDDFYPGPARTKAHAVTFTMSGYDLAKPEDWHKRKRPFVC